MNGDNTPNSLKAMLHRATWKDVGAGALVLLLIAEGPLTPAARIPSILAGLVAAAFFIYWRLSQPIRARSDPASGRWHVPLGIWICLALFAAAAAPTLAWMYREWTGSVWHNTHGMLIPVLMIMLGRNILRRMEPVEDEPSLWGMAFLIPGLTLMLIDAGSATRYISALGIVICLPGLSLLSLGPARTRALALPLTLAIFMIPLPNSFASQIYLRTLTASAVAPVLTAIGIPTFVDRSLLELPQASFLVANSCSGFSTLYSGLAMGLLLGTLCPSRGRRLLVYLSIIPLALVANIVRVVALVLIALYVDPNLLDTGAHAASGVVTFFGVLGVLILLADRPRLSRALL